MSNGSFTLIYKTGVAAEQDRSKTCDRVKRAYYDATDLQCH